MAKIKKEKQEAAAAADESIVADVSVVKEEDTYAEKVKNANQIASPMASKKLTKKCYKLIKKVGDFVLIEVRNRLNDVYVLIAIATQHKTFLRNGLKDVQSRLNKGETGIVIFAGDVTPIEIMCHLPGVCEDKGVPYAYTPSRLDLGAAMGVKRGTVSLLIREHPDYQELFDELKSEINGLAAPL